MTGNESLQNCGIDQRLEGMKILRELKCRQHLPLSYHHCAINKFAVLKFNIISLDSKWTLPFWPFKLGQKSKI